MAEQFLHQLLRKENSVHSDESQQCHICLSEFGTLSSDTGVIECQIRLPCNHTLGSACIATWLKSNNTCPVCRHVLFPRPADDDDDDVDDDDDESQIVRSGRTSPVYIDTDDEEYDEHLSTRVARAARISELTFSYSAALHLNASITICSHGIAEKCGSLNSLPGRSEASIAAASVYMASHIGLQPKTLREISQLADNTEGTIQTVYRRIYAYFHTMPEGTWTQICRGLPWHSDDWPPLEHEFVAGETGEDEEYMEDIWSQFSTELHLQPTVVTIAKRMAIKLEAWPALASYEPISLAAICIYIASYIAGSPESHVEVARVAGDSLSFLLSAYEQVYADREQLLDSTMTTVDLPRPSSNGDPPF